MTKLVPEAFTFASVSFVRDLFQLRRIFRLHYPYCFHLLFFSKVLVLSRLDGVLEFLELGDRFSTDGVTENSENSVILPSMRRKAHTCPSSWKTVVNSVSNDQFPCHFCRAHRKTISVLATCKDLVISGSFDNLLKVR